ncbi:MAG: lytic transglycosylase domain-containing protein [Thermoanaerobaculia bacterium]
MEIAASRTRDFYARQAGLRLAGVALPEPGPDRPLVEPWPSDPRLARADLLSDLGLDRLALVEAEELATEVDPRAAAALRGRALARQGAWRESLRALRKAFPQLGTAHQESVPREALALYYPRPFDERVRRFAESQNLPSSLVFGIVHQESGFDAAAVSRSGARGLMQLMPSTARELSRRLGIPYSTRGLLEPEVSLRLGTTYFRQMLGMFDDRVELALASYNGGPGRIGRLWRERGSSPEVDLFLEDLSVEESRNYVKRILLLAESYRSLYSDLS